MLLEVKNLRIGIGKNNEEIIKNINFSIEEKTCLGILGESGSGKSITCKSILNLVNKKFNVSGEIIFQGRDLLKLSQEEIRKVRGKDISMVLQNPMTSFNPLYTIENQMIETFLEHMDISREKALEISKEALEKMSLKNIGKKKKKK